MKQLIEKIKELLNQIPLPGFKGISILSLLKFLKEVFSKGNFAIRSAAVSFHFFSLQAMAIHFLSSFYGKLH